MPGNDKSAVYLDKCMAKTSVQFTVTNSEHTATSQCTMANEGKDQSVEYRDKSKATLQCTTAIAWQHYSVPRQKRGNITVYHGKRKATLQYTTANARQHYSVPQQTQRNITVYHGKRKATLQCTTANARQHYSVPRQTRGRLSPVDSVTRPRQKSHTGHSVMTNTRDTMSEPLQTQPSWCFLPDISKHRNAVCNEKHNSHGIVCTDKRKYVTVQ